MERCTRCRKNSYQVRASLKWDLKDGSEFYLGAFFYPLRNAEVFEHTFVGCVLVKTMRGDRGG